MARLIPRPAPETVEPGERAAYDSVVARQTKLWEGAPMNSNDYFDALLNSPPLAAAVVELGRVFRTGALRGTYSDADRELVDMVLGTDLGYNTIVKLHIPDALAVGVRLEAIEAIRAGELDRLTDGERQIVDYARAVMAGAVTDNAHAAMTERLGTRGALEFTMFVAFLQFTFRAWQGVGVADVPDSEIEELLERYRRDEIAPLDPLARHG
jgi:hypothetical protein